MSEGPHTLPRERAIRRLAGLVLGLLVSAPIVFATVVASSFGESMIAALETPFVVFGVGAVAVAVPLTGMLLRASHAQRPFAAAAASFGIVLVAAALLALAAAALVAGSTVFTMLVCWAPECFRAAVWVPSLLAVAGTLTTSIPVTPALARRLTRPGGPRGTEPPPAAARGPLI
ncbi:hypothetical protein N1031_04605 [Herbiconiux moechotypicola]|uniref:Uncharacterized protein n=1 Tax=Herbiconiux moechotypicola TaxID=637393 RepID=A0ABN3DA33_9MICO|nr:hypothetical protein [Herbiconiux moechotypicola]MCS5729032.1 hypothetical protein [Herbiconiux moechotypicola]